MTTQARGCSALHAHAAAPLERGQFTLQKGSRMGRSNIENSKRNPVGFSVNKIQDTKG